jgi:hypothetical protein
MPIALYNVEMERCQAVYEQKHGQLPPSNLSSDTRCFVDLEQTYTADGVRKVGAAAVGDVTIHLVDAPGFQNDVNADVVANEATYKKKLREIVRNGDAVVVCWCFSALETRFSQDVHGKIMLDIKQKLHIPVIYVGTKYATTAHEVKHYHDLMRKIRDVQYKDKVMPMEAFVAVRSYSHPDLGELPSWFGLDKLSKEIAKHLVVPPSDAWCNIL